MPTADLAAFGNELKAGIRYSLQSTSLQTQEESFLDKKWSKVVFSLTNAHHTALVCNYQQDVKSVSKGSYVTMRRVSTGMEFWEKRIETNGDTHRKGGGAI